MAVLPAVQISRGHACSSSWPGAAVPGRRDEAASCGPVPFLCQVLVSRVKLHVAVAPPVHVGDDDSRRAAQACCAVHVHTLAALHCLCQRLHCLGQHATQAVWIKVARLQAVRWMCCVLLWKHSIKGWECETDQRRQYSEAKAANAPDHTEQRWIADEGPLSARRYCSAQLRAVPMQELYTRLASALRSPVTHRHPVQPYA
jgi:hypothetical protein